MAKQRFHVPAGSEVHRGVPFWQRAIYFLSGGGVAFLSGRWLLSGEAGDAWWLALTLTAAGVCGVYAAFQKEEKIG